MTKTPTEVLLLRNTVQLLRSALQGLLGADDPKDLNRMRSAILGMRVPDSDKLAALGAIDALLITEEVRT